MTYLRKLIQETEIDSRKKGSKINEIKTHLYGGGAGDNHGIKSRNRGRSDVQCVLEFFHHHLTGHLATKKEKGNVLN